MNKPVITLLAALFACGSWTVARADQDDGHHRGHRQHLNRGYNGQCYSNGRYRQDGDQDRDDQGDRDDRARNCVNCNYNNNGRYNPNGQYYPNGQYNPNGQYYSNGQYYPNGQYYSNNCGNYNGNYGGQYGRGNAVVRGTIVAINGNQVTLATQNYATMTINDQPALDRQASGRVAIGRFVTAYGYWNGNEFFATQMN